MTLYAKWTTKEGPKRYFKDVDYNKWMGNAIEYVTARGYMVGVSETLFAPNDSCSREMVVQILYNVKGKPEVKGECSFKDAKAGKWYYNSLIWAKQTGVTSGKGDSSFGVGDKVTRQGIAQFLYNYAKLNNYDIAAGTDISAFPDCGETADWAIEAVKWANGAGVMNGKQHGGKKYLDPSGEATRAEVAQMLMNFMQKVAKQE